MIKPETLAYFKAEKKCSCGETHKEAWGVATDLAFWFDCSNCHSCLIVLKDEWLPTTESL
jgi:hypothetical protein